MDRYSKLLIIITSIECKHIVSIVVWSETRLWNDENTFRKKTQHVEFATACLKSLTERWYTTN